MKYVDEYHDAALAGHVVAEISRLSGDRPLTLMQIGRRHIHTLYKYGIQDLLPWNITMVHGPGCPACVLPRGRIDDALSVAYTDGVIFTAFADTLRVPGSRGSLVEARAEGADVRSVSSPLDALKLAQQHPQQQVVFFAVGFETTAAATAATLLQAGAEGVQNFSILCNHVTMLPALKALLEKPDQHLDGLVVPGHVSMVTGLHPYEVLAHQYHKPVVIAGFEPLDLLLAIQILVQQISEGRAEVENQYARVVQPDGKRKALEVISRTMMPRPFFEWRGVGNLAWGALEIRPEFAEWDAELRFKLPGIRAADPEACSCSEVLQGLKHPSECLVFGTSCTPETPIGACMASAAGACAVSFSYGRFSIATGCAIRSRMVHQPAAR